MKKIEYQRLNKYMAQTGQYSRRKADELIKDGRVNINGKKAVLGDQVGPDDIVKVNGQPIFVETMKFFILFHKPYGVICTADPKADNTIFQYLPKNMKLIPVGRLDVESSGLMLLTNDGEVANKIMHPSTNHEKEYIVEVGQALTPDFLRKMSQGILLSGSKTKPAKVHKINDHTFSIILTEGRNRQIRRMCEAFDYEVNKLCRVRVMDLTLDKLRPGEYRELKKAEVHALLKNLK